MVARTRQPLYEPQISDAEDLAAALAEAERCRRDVNASYSTERIVAAIAGAASDWLQPDEELRLLAIEQVARATGYHRDMVATGLDFIFSAVTVEGLERLAKTEADSRPRAIFYSLAGNVPGLGVPAVARSLLTRSIVILRDSERQPILTAAFRETLRRYDPALAAMVVPVVWSHRGGDRALERFVLEVAERVEVYGSDRTVGELAERYRAGRVARLSLHGSRVSAGLVLARADIGRAARDFAVDVTMYEGRGCLTPHLIFVEGEAARTTFFTDALARELASCEARWPRAQGSVEEETERRRFIDNAEMHTLAAPHAAGRIERFLLGEASAWCVQQTSDISVTPGPGLRCVRVAHVRGCAEAIDALGAARPSLAAVGIAGVTTHGATSRIDDTPLRDVLRGVGATLVCPAGRMQAPPIDWSPESCPPDVESARESR